MAVNPLIPQAGFNTPLMSLAAGLIAGGAPSTQPGGLQRGLSSGIAAMQQAQQSQAALALRQAQLDSQLEAQRLKREQEERALAQTAQTRQALANELLRLNQDPGLAADPTAARQRISQLSAPETPSGLQKEFEFAQDQGYKGNFIDYVELKGSSSAGDVTITNDAGQPVQIKDFGTGGMFAYWVGEDGKLQTKVVRTPGMSAEAAGRVAKLENIDDVMAEYGRLATSFEEQGLNVTGGLRGRWNEFAARNRLDPSAEASQLWALQNAMTVQLGTAFSGAAIPVTEWPKYEALIPTMADSPETRRSKLFGYKKAVGNLVAIQQAKMSGGDAPEVIPMSVIEAEMQQSMQNQGMGETSALPVEQNPTWVYTPEGGLQKAQ